MNNVECSSEGDEELAERTSEALRASQTRSDGFGYKCTRKK